MLRIEMERIFYLLEECSTIRNIVLLMGLLYLLRTTVGLIRSLWSGTKAYLLSDLFRVKLTPSSYKWAVVTGASSGIGKGYAIQLAKCGINVVLMSNVVNDLELVEKEILDQYDVSVKIIVVDFSGGAEIYDKIRMELSGLEIGILINNVGASYAYPDYFLNVPEDRLWKIINVNVATIVMMTKMIMPDMLDKKRGIIVNISSSGALDIFPLLAVYTATKSFVRHFTLALQYEYSGKGVIIQLVTPGAVATATSGIKKSFTVLDPSKYAQDAVTTIGVQSTTFGTMRHALQRWLLQLFPPWVVAAFIYSYLIDLKKQIIEETRKKN